MKTVLILTGPQGSGNHMWSKIFALHPQVQGWQALLDEYWIGHDREPFADIWQTPERAADFDWDQSNYYVTSISVPYALNGTITVPNVERFVTAVKQQHVKVKLVVLGRDRNIVSMQEQRVRGKETYNHAIDLYQQLEPDYFLSYELLHMYKSKYLKTVSQQLNFPIDYNNSRLENIISVDTNSKYFCAVDRQPTDDLAQQASRKWQ